MATVINNPPSNTSSNNGMGFLWGVLLLILAVLLFLYYGLPRLGTFFGYGNPQVNIPSRIDVHVNK